MFTYDDSHLGNGNAHNGIIDLPDVSSSVARTSVQIQTQKIDEFRLAGAWETGQQHDARRRRGLSQVHHGTVAHVTAQITR